MLTRAMIVEKMERYLSENIEEARNIASQVNGWDSSLEELYVYDMTEFDYIIDSMELGAMELVCKIEHGDFNSNDDYFMFDELDNLVSYQEWEYEELVKEYISEIVERYIELAGHVYADAEMEALIEAYEECEYDC